MKQCNWGKHLIFSTRCTMDNPIRVQLQYEDPATQKISAATLLIKTEPISELPELSPHGFTPENQEERNSF